MNFKAYLPIEALAERKPYLGKYMLFLALPIAALHTALLAYMLLVPSVLLNKPIPCLLAYIVACSPAAAIMLSVRPEEGLAAVVPFVSKMPTTVAVLVGVLLGAYWGAGRIAWPSIGSGSISLMMLARLALSNGIALVLIWGSASTLGVVIGFALDKVNRLR